MRGVHGVAPNINLGVAWINILYLFERAMVLLFSSCFKITNNSIR